MRLKVFILVLTGLICGVYADTDYAGIAVHETAGIDRELWPVRVGVTVPAGASSDSLLLVQVEENGDLRSVEFDLVEEIDSHGLDERRGPIRGIKSFEIVFLTELPADASLDFRLYYGDVEADVAPAPESPQMHIEKGEGIARTVDTGVASFEFHAASGQMTKYELADIDHSPQFYRRGRNEPIHGSGDLRTSRNNVRNWNIENESHGMTYDESAGNIMWQSVRAGFIPHTDQQVEISVTYTAFAGMPFINTTTHVYFHSDWAIEALRNNQLVFSRGHHTHGIYIDHDGGVNKLQAHDQDDFEKHFGDLGVGALPADIPFIGMLHEDHGYGIGFINQARTNLPTRRPTTLRDSGAHWHFLDSSLHGVGSPNNFFYLVRYEAYHGNHRLVMPSGSSFSSTSTILTYPVVKDDENRFEELKLWNAMLMNPPRVYAK